MFPYFNPIYNFEDGFNVIAPENPLQVTIVLILIIEDFLKGCRNIKFNIEADEKLAAYPDKLDSAMEDWASYYEDLKKYINYFEDMEPLPLEFNKLESIQYLLDNNLYIASACNKLIKKSLFKDSMAL